MRLSQNILCFSVILLLVAFYLHYTIDENIQKDYILKALFKTFDIMSTLDKWLRHIGLNGIRRNSEDLFAWYIYSKMNTSGLIIDVRHFDSIEVIMFDVLNHKDKRPAIVFIHGGGWSYSSPRFYSGFTGNLARRLNTLVISVDYRKSPEHPYPAGFNDILTAVKHLYLHAEQYNVDPDQIAIMGDSAGGNLAVAVTYHLCEERHGSKISHIPKLLIPLCPVMQIADMQLPSMIENVNDPMITQRMVIFSICKYAFGNMPDSELLECVEAVSSNSHLNKETIAKVKRDMDWTRYLTGPQYDNRSPSHYNHIENKFKSRLSQLAMDPRMSPLSALNDSQLSLLPRMIVFGASKDPLRDDARLLASRANNVGNLAIYYESDFFHDPFLYSMLELTEGVQSVDILERLFRQYLPL